MSVLDRGYAMQDGRMHLAQIAASLGYAEQTSFTRAFRRWTGESPGACRCEACLCVSGRGRRPAVRFRAGARTSVRAAEPRRRRPAASSRMCRTATTRATMPHPLVKICCIGSPGEAQLAIACGAAAIGLVSAMPSGPGVIDEDQIARIAATVKPPAQTFLLTALQHADAIVAQHARCRTTTLQLVDHVPHAELVALRAALPGVTLVQVIHVVGNPSIDEALAAYPFVDALLLDSGNQTLAVKELGGTGRTHDWRLNRRIREAAPQPVWLAGGLRPENVAEAVAAVEPHGLDLCNSVRTDGLLDRTKLERFFASLPA